MPSCRNCNTQLKRQTNGMLKCPTCNVVYKPGQNTPLLSKYAPAGNTALKSQGDQDLETFINRVTQKLLPIYKDYPENVKKVSLQNRQTIKAAFLKVTDGKMSFKKWFDYIHTTLGKHPVDLAKILVDACQDLNSPEIKEFRQGALQFQTFIAEMYNAGSSGM